MNAGFIKLHRKMLEWEWYSDINTTRLFMHLILTANYKDKKYKGKIIPRGSLATTIPKLSEETALTVKEVRTALNHLKMTSEVGVQTTNRESVIKVHNYCVYQERKDDFEQENGRQKSVQRQSNGERTEEEIKKERNISLTDCRQRYTDLQLKVIDKYFEILKHTRKSCALAESIYLKSYQDWEKHEQAKVIHALEKYINNPALHDKKENYVLGIINNTTMAEVEKSKTKTENPPQGNPWLKLKT